MLSFLDYTEQLDERLIMLQNGAKYNQVLILSGGAASGKGFALSNFIDSSNYKVRDVDEIKKLLMKIDKLGNLDVKGLWEKDSDAKDKLEPKDFSKVDKVLKQYKYKIANLDLKIPEHVYTLHIVADIVGWKKKSIELLKKTVPSNSDHKPNIAFDITAKDMNAVNKAVQSALSMGYDTKNIHLVWVLTDYQVAIKNNKGRERVVPKDIVLNTHLGAANTMTDLLGGNKPKNLDGAIWVILNNKKNTIFWKKGDGALRKTPEFHEDSYDQEAVAKVDQEKYDKIYGDGAFVKRNKRTKGKFGKEQLVVKTFSRIHAKKAGKKMGSDVLDFKLQLFNWVISNIPSEATKALRTSYGIILGKHNSPL